MPSLLADTHIVVRWLFGGRRLSREQARVLDVVTNRGETIAISAMSLLEMAALHTAGKLELDISLRQAFAMLQENPSAAILPITYEIAEEVAALGDNLRDPADRTIVATARVHRLRLVTSDVRIIESGLVPIID